ncbi:hypothetical protein Tco_0512767, partial [Tanacetum coccineum]
GGEMVVSIGVDGKVVVNGDDGSDPNDDECKLSERSPDDSDESQEVNKNGEVAGKVATCFEDGSTDRSVSVSDLGKQSGKVET